MIKKFLLTIVYTIDWVLRLFVKLVTFLGIKRWVSRILIAIVRVIFAIFHILYFRMTVHGHRNIPHQGGVLIAANHQSYLDPHLVGLSVWRNVTFISKKENFEIPILGPIIELGNAYPIVRGGDDEALAFFADLLKKGHVLVIFPEGTIPAEEQLLRSHIEPQTGLLKGKTGVIRLALKAKVPIVPLGISGSGRALCPEAIPRGQKLPIPRPTKITMCFGKPIDLSSYDHVPVSRELLRKLTDELMMTISKQVDHTMNYIPLTVPVSEETYRKLREFEASQNQNQKEKIK